VLSVSFVVKIVSSAKPRSSPGTFRRLLFRLPLLLDRLGSRTLERAFAGALGVDWIVLETRGRRSGRPHTVVLDVVGHDTARDVYYIQPASGRAADWVRNVTANPDVAARVGERRFQGHVRDATGREGADVVLNFLRAHPWYGRMIVWFVGYVDRIDRPDDALRRDLATTPVFAVEAANSTRR
jgi:deazaflavin-dependent oxidoreductase (nitroreductase family)